MSTLGQGPSPKKNSSSTMGRLLLGMDVAEDKGGNLPLVVTLQTVLWNRKSVKARKDNRENGSAWGKGCHYSIPCLVPNTAILFCLYNHSQQLEGRADGTGTYLRDPIQEEENYYKRGWREPKRVGRRPPPPPKNDNPVAPGRAPHSMPRTNPFWKTQSIPTWP